MLENKYLPLVDGALTVSSSSDDDSFPLFVRSRNNIYYISMNIIRKFMYLEFFPFFQIFYICIPSNLEDCPITLLSGTN